MSLNKQGIQMPLAVGVIRGTKYARARQVMVLLVVSVLAAGCSLPGWQLDIDDDAAWYGESESDYGSAAAVAAERYDPIVRQITPRLISRMWQQNAAKLAAPGVEARLPHVEEEYGAYHVGSGDLLGIIVYGHPDLTNPAGTTQSVESSGRLVDQDGEIFVPFIGEVDVAGRTLDQIRKIITAGLSRVIRNPQVDIQVLKYRSQKVYITGDISQPCTVSIRDIPLTVVDALDACRSLLSERDPGASGVNAVQLVRDNNIYPLNLSRLYRQGGEPIKLLDGDRLIVDDSFNRIFMIGEFEKQAAIPYSAGGMTLADAMMSVGGLNLATADSSGIYVIRGTVERPMGDQPTLAFRLQPHVYHLDASSVDALILADQFQLQPRDVIYAAPASLVNFNRALAQITPSVNLLFQTALIYDQTRD